MSESKSQQNSPLQTKAEPQVAQPEFQGPTMAPPALQLQATQSSPIQRQDEPATDYDSLAQQIYDGVHHASLSNGLTDEAAIFNALSQVQGNASAIRSLRQAYQSNHNENMITAVRAEFQTQGNTERFASLVAADLTSLCIILHSSLGNHDRTGVNAALKQVTGDQARVQALRSRYQQLYNENLRVRIQTTLGLRSGGSTALGLMDNEYASMEEYRSLTGRSELGPYEWLTADRESQSGSWDTAMVNMTRDQVPNILEPFVQVRDYYIWVARKIEEKGHESRWVLGALVLVNELADTYEEGVFVTGQAFSVGVLPILEDLNVGIANYAITQFHRLLYGDFSDVVLRGQQAYEFDLQFVNHEQREVAFPIYEQYAGTSALSDMNGLFNGTGFVGNAAEMLGPAIPTHPDIIGSDLTDAGTRYGEDARTNVPLWMLWPELHRSTNAQSPNGPLNPNMTRMDAEMESGQGSVFESYQSANRNIMSKDW